MTAEGADALMLTRGILRMYTGEESPFPVEGPIKTRADLERYVPPDPQVPGRYASIEEIVARFKGRLAIGVHLNDVVSLPRYLLGFEELMFALAEDPALVQGLVKLSVDVNLETAKGHRRPRTRAISPPSRRPRGRPAASRSRSLPARDPRGTGIRGGGWGRRC